MSKAWGDFFARAHTPRKVLKLAVGDWYCSACLKQFKRACNAGLHCYQALDCRELHGMIFQYRGGPAHRDDSETVEVKPLVGEQKELIPNEHNVAARSENERGVQESNESASLLGNDIQVRRTTRLDERN